ncbi:MAG: hypothetical protein J7M14_05090 [Planctomycetes bacterium]|nr:hypothetical protein [Planctomycetota bacterium]
MTKGDADASPPRLASVLVRLDATDIETSLRSVEAARAARAAEIKVAHADITGKRADNEAIEACFTAGASRGTCEETRRCDVCGVSPMREHGDP